ncbi:PREDICTED: ABC transporter F family member 4-like [Camelina sativa]|uniref:ABC transporter F family member 4-like n=1 Tax=Camelina sativa TaxID=90675 RepID=A0ABM0ZHK1_CAMSA|nr:PREDICTED: ABC transporter F family member 4-like [Camelina sativa]
MTRKKATVVLPQPIRRSARLISMQNRGSQVKPNKDLGFFSEPPKKTRREVLRELSKRLVYSLDSPIGNSSSKKYPGLKISTDGLPSLTRSLRLSSKECSGDQKEKSALTSSSSRTKSSTTTVSSSCGLRRSPRFLSGGGGGSVNQSSSSSTRRKSSNSVLSRCSTKSVSSEKGKGGDGVKSKDRSRSRLRPQTKQLFKGCDDNEEEEEEEEEVSVCLLSQRKRMRIKKPNENENAVPKADEVKRTATQKEKGLTTKKKHETGKGVLSRCSTKSVSSEKGKGGDGVKSKARRRTRLRSQTKQLFKGCDDSEEEEEVSVCLSQRKRKRIAKPNEDENAVPKADEVNRMGKQEEEGSKTKKKHETGGWTEELELALQGAYLTVKPSPHFWKKVAKMVPGKSAQECFDRVNSALITPRQHQPRRSRKANLSTIPQFSLSASKLLKPNSPKTKVRQRRNNLSKKTVRHLLEKQNHMDQGLGFDLFSVLEPSISGNFLSTPIEKRQSLSKIRESPVLCSSKDQTALVSPPVLKQVKNKALHERYIDHLHTREAKRKAESTRFAGKENIRPVEIQKKDSVRAAKDALLFDVQEAIQKLKGLEAENSSSSSEFCYDHGETDEED